MRGLELDPGLTDGHLALAEVLKTLDWDWRGAEVAYHRAIEAAPSCDSAHRAYGVFLAKVEALYALRVEQVVEGDGWNFDRFNGFLKVTFQRMVKHARYYGFCWPRVI